MKTSKDIYKKFTLLSQETTRVFSKSWKESKTEHQISFFFLLDTIIRDEQGHKNGKRSLIVSEEYLINGKVKRDLSPDKARYEELAKYIKWDGFNTKHVSNSSGLHIIDILRGQSCLWKDLSKEQRLEKARKEANWPEATREELGQYHLHIPQAEVQLSRILAARREIINKQFLADMEELGFDVNLASRPTFSQPSQAHQEALKV